MSLGCGTAILVLAGLCAVQFLGTMRVTVQHSVVDTAAFDIPKHIMYISDTSSLKSDEVPAATESTKSNHETDNSMPRQFTPYFQKRYQYQPPEARSAFHAEQAGQECGSAPAFANYFRLGPQNRSVNNEDRTLYRRLFQGLDQSKNYTFIELGGFDGMTETNSRFFETCLGWEGLLVEANPKAYSKLVQSRPHTHRASYAASCSEEEAAQNKTVQFHSKAWSNSAQVDVPSAYSNDTDAIVTVPCGPLTPLIQDLFGGHLTLFSLDVENAEPLVLSQIDFNAVFIEVLIVESSNQFCKAECPSRDQARAIMKEKGYHLFPSVVTKSDLYIHPKSSFLERIQPTAVVL
jgi:hypothetical protein